MPFEIRPVRKEDAPEVAALGQEAFSGNRFISVIAPPGPHPALIEQIIKGIETAIDDPDSYVYQIYDTTNNRMAAYATWVYTKPMNDAEWDAASQERFNSFPEARQDIYVPFVRKERAAKRRVMGHHCWWELDALNTRPSYQRKGLASMLMKWGIDQLEERGLQSVIVASEIGHPLYVKFGYHLREEWVLDLTPLGGEGSYRNTLLTRMPLKSANPQQT